MKNLYSEISSTLPSQPLRRFIRLVAGERKSIVQIYLYAIIAGVIGLSLPLGIQAIINLVSAGAVTTSWFVLITVVTLGILVGGILQILQLSISESIQQRIFVKSALELSFRIPRLDATNLRKHYIPELLNRFFDTVTVQKGLSKILLDFSTASLQIIFGLILLSFYHPFFILFGFILLLFLFVIVRVTGPMGLRTSLKESKYKYQVAHWLEEMGRKKNLFQGLNPGKMSMGKTDQLTINYLGARKSHFRILIIKYIILLLFKVIIISGLLIVGSLLVIENQLNLGQFVAAEIIIILIINSIEKLIPSVETIYDVLTGLEKIGYITDLPLEEELEDRMKDECRTTSIDFHNYTLKFPGTKEPELSEVSFSAEPGEKIWISGGEPHTRQALIRSLAGDFTQYSGKLSIGGIPIRNWDKEQLRGIIGIYQNANDIADTTILDNVTLHSGPVPLSQVIKIASALGLDQYVDQFENGWNTMAGPDGSMLPDAVKPMIILCRLLLGNPKILLLSALDSTVEEDLCQRFRKVLDKDFKDTTQIVLDSHKFIPSTFDRVFRFDGPSIDSTVPLLPY